MKRIRPSIKKQIEKHFKNNNNNEIALMKYPKNKLAEIIGKSSEHSANPSPKKIKEYREKLRKKIKNYKIENETTIHTHRKYSIPSKSDLIKLLLDNISENKSSFHIATMVNGKVGAITSVKLGNLKTSFVDQFTNLILERKNPKEFSTDASNLIFKEYLLFKARVKKDKNVLDELEKKSNPKDVLEFYKYLGFNIRIKPTKGYKLNNKLQVIKE